MEDKEKLEEGGGEETIRKERSRRKKRLSGKDVEQINHYSHRN